MSALDLDALESLLAAATPGEWQAENEAAAPSTAWGVHAPDDSDPEYPNARQYVVMADFVGGSDARLIAALRNAAPKLLRIARAVESLIHDLPTLRWVAGRDCCRQEPCYGDERVALSNAIAERLASALKE